jgi:hypothetical protein
VVRNELRDLFGAAAFKGKHAQAVEAGHRSSWVGKAFILLRILPGMLPVNDGEETTFA